MVWSVDGQAHRRLGRCDWPPLQHLQTAGIQLEHLVFVLQVDKNVSRPVGRQAPKGGPQLALDAHRSYQSLELDQDAQRRCPHRSAVELETTETFGGEPRDLLHY